MPLHFFGSKTTISRFDERFRDGQYSLVSFLLAVLLLTVPPCPAICKSGEARAPVPYGVGATAMVALMRRGCACKLRKQDEDGNSFWWIGGDGVGWDRMGTNCHLNVTCVVSATGGCGVALTSDLVVNTEQSLAVSIS